MIFNKHFLLWGFILGLFINVPADAAGVRDHRQTSECNANPNQIALFEHSDYRGRCVVKGIGEYSTAAAIGLPNDSVSSVKVGSNVWATICRDSNYKGGCEIFPSNVQSLRNTTVGNDRVSSLKVGIRPVVVLSESIFVGRSSHDQVLENDRDRDGLNDTLEAVLAEQFKPVLKFDRNENARRPDEPITLFQVRPLGCVGAGCPQGAGIVIRWAFLFVRDGGYGPGSYCHGRDSHAGDNDRATFVLRSFDRGRSWTVTELHLGGDPQKVEGSIRWPRVVRIINRTFAQWIELEGAHPNIYMSSGKHHMFMHRGDWDDSPYSNVRFWDDCGDDVDGDGAVVTPNLRSAALGGAIGNNVGEPEAHSPQWFVNDLNHLFSAQQCPTGRHAWSRDKFCGNGASENVRNWLTVSISYRP